MFRAGASGPSPQSHELPCQCRRAPRRLPGSYVCCIFSRCRSGCLFGWRQFPLWPGSEQCGTLILGAAGLDPPTKPARLLHLAATAFHDGGGLCAKARPPVVRLPEAPPQPVLLHSQRRRAPRSHAMVGRYPCRWQYQHRRHGRQPNQIRVDHHDFHPPSPVGLTNLATFSPGSARPRRLLAPFCYASVAARAAARRFRCPVRRAPRYIQRAFNPGYPVAQVVHVPAQFRHVPSQRADLPALRSDLATQALPLCSDLAPQRPDRRQDHRQQGRHHSDGSEQRGQLRTQSSDSTVPAPRAPRRL